MRESHQVLTYRDIRIRKEKGVLAKNYTKIAKFQVPIDV